MEPALKLEPPSWMTEDATKRIMQLLNDEGASPQTLFVGGAVRNLVLEKAVHDIDLATKFAPQGVAKRLTAAGVKVIPTGIDHGTVTAVIDGQHFEITTLRHDMKTDGRHAEVRYTDDWVEDARRRDFTVNTLLADLQGNIYDPLGQGLADAKAGRVVFVGEPAKRIEEDCLRILRFFRFYAFYGRGEMDSAALEACRAAAGNISTLSRERITQEFLKILSVRQPQDILKIMFDYNVLSDVCDENYQSEVLQKLFVLQDKYEAVNVEARLFVLAGNRAGLFDKYMRLSHAQKKFIIKLEMLKDVAFYADEKALKTAIFHHGNALLLQGYLLNIANGQGKEDLAMIEAVTNWQAPVCPIKGETLIAEGYVTGPDLGQELARRQDEWLEDNL